MRPHTPVGLDFEFLEDGRTIKVISVGLSQPSGQDYYAVNRDMPQVDIANHAWLWPNVVPHLPRLPAPTTSHDWLDKKHPDVKSLKRIAKEVKEFLQEIPDPLLVADYGAYDKVRLNQLWGPMVSQPEGLPWWHFDLQQLLFELEENPGDIELPAQKTPEHHALNDARWSLGTYYWLRDREREIRGS